MQDIPQPVNSQQQKRTRHGNVLSSEQLVGVYLSLDSSVCLGWVHCWTIKLTVLTALSGKHRAATSTVLNEHRTPWFKARSLYLQVKRTALRRNSKASSYQWHQQLAWPPVVHTIHTFLFLSATEITFTVTDAAPCGEQAPLLLLFNTSL